VSLGGSEYLWTLHAAGGRLAPLDLEVERRVRRRFAPPWEPGS